MSAPAMTRASSALVTPAPLGCDRSPALFRKPVETPGVQTTTSIPLFFLRRLIADAGLRAALEAAPARTLARHGIQAAPEAIPAKVSLPSRRELESVVTSLATEEDRSAIFRFGGFLGC